MYLSVDDARSDFFLASATYLLGAIVLSFVVEITGTVFRTGAGLWAFTLIAPVLVTAAMPLYLMRYRGESVRQLWSGGGGVLHGVLFGVLVGVGALLGSVVGGSNALQSIPALEPGRLVVARLVAWLSLAVLVTFLHRRAEYAFRPISERQELLVRYAAIAALGTAGIASLLLTLSGSSIGLLGAPAGFAAAYLLGLRTVPPTGMGERWQVWSPLIVLAIGEISIFSLLTAGQDFLIQARTGGMVVTFGLLSIMLLSARRGGAATYALAATIGLVSNVTTFGATF